jgi:hypothetical protein
MAGLETVKRWVLGIAALVGGVALVRADSRGMLLAGFVILVAVLWRPGRPRPWSRAYYCQTCGAVYPLRPPARCQCGCVRFFQEEATSEAQQPPGR